MFRTIALSALGLAVAAGAPLLYHNANAYLKAKPAAKVAKAPVTTGGESVGKMGPETPVEGPMVGHLAEVFRFDITPTWVVHRWPRVSTGMGQVQLQGYRVTLVTGTDQADLAGSLTYFFNPHQQLQRIAFYGTTGNPQKLVALLTSQYHFARRIVNDPGLFIWEVPELDGKPKSLLQMQAAEVIKQNEPYRHFKLSLVLERPTES